MNDNLLQVHNNQPMADSREVAKNFGKRHDNIVRDIRALVADSAGMFGRLNFEETYYTDSRNRFVCRKRPSNRAGLPRYSPRQTLRLSEK